MGGTMPLRRFLALSLLLFFAATIIAAPPADKNQDFRGKVVPLASVLEKEGAKLDADATPHWLALVTDDGKVYPLVKDDGGRMFFKDPRLLNRPMVLTSKLLFGGLLQVVAVHSVVKGEL